MDIHVSHHEGIPVYQQIVAQIINLIIGGRLRPHQELLPIRKLAEKLVVNPNTIARAYRQLEEQRWIYKRRGAGTFVSEESVKLAGRYRHSIIADHIENLLAEAAQMNVPEHEIVTMLKVLIDQRANHDLRNGTVK